MNRAVTTTLAASALGAAALVGLGLQPALADGGEGSTPAPSATSSQGTPNQGATERGATERGATDQGTTDDQGDHRSSPRGMGHEGRGGHGGHRHGGPEGGGLDAAASTLGMTEDELRTALQSRTLGQIADEKGVERSALVDAMVAPMRERLTAMLDEKAPARGDHGPQGQQGGNPSQQSTPQGDASATTAPALAG